MNDAPTILVVDDDPSNLTVLAEVLEQDYRIRVAKSGRQALQAAASAPCPDLVILDIEMPGMSGYQVLERLREDPVTQAVPVIFITARTATLDEERGLELGAADYITKPIRPTIVRARVRTQLENKRARDLLEEHNVWLREDLLRAQRVGRIGSWKLDLEADILEWSPETYRLFGVEEGAPLRSDAFLAHVAPADRDRVEAAWQAALNGAPYDVEFRTVGGGGRRWLREVAEFEGWKDGVATLALGTVQDVTERKRHEQRLEELAFVDPLTGLANRHALAQRLEQRLAADAHEVDELTLFLVDLDGFGRINARMGERAGDEVLRVCAQRLAGWAGDAGEVARLGGDQFVVARYGGLGGDGAVSHAKALLELLAQPISLEADTVPVSACIGSVRNAGNALRHAGPLLRAADQAMYQAKLEGKGRHVAFDLTQFEAERSLQDRIGEIRTSLKDRRFALYYQPKVDLRGGGLIGLEALVRWRHPDRGLLGPGEFLPTIDGHPLMVEFGDWVIDEALAQLLAWQGEGLSAAVSVNVAANQLEHPAFVERLSERLRSRPWLDPARFEVEILESGPMADRDLLVETRGRLEALGVSVALDDFGTGHASLQTLNALRPNVLKIDRSFVLAMLTDGKSRAIAQAILDLGRVFGLQVVAEGLETPEHAEALLGLGGRYAQGYAVARPMPPEQLPVWLARWREAPPPWIVPAGEDRARGDRREPPASAG